MMKEKIGSKKSEVRRRAFLPASLSAGEQGRPYGIGGRLGRTTAGGGGGGILFRGIAPSHGDSAIVSLLFSVAAEFADNILLLIIFDTNSIINKNRLFITKKYTVTS